MYVDAQLLFSDAQGVTSAARSTNIIDLESVRDIGTGRSLYVCLVVDVALTDASSNSTITVSLYGDSTTTITPDGSQDLFSIPALTAAGTKFFAKLDPGSAALQYQYISLYYTPVNGDLSTGSFTAFLALDIDKYLAYADNIVIS